MAETKNVIDLTKPLGSETEIFSDDEYTDPEFSVSEWSSVETEGFRVSSIRIGTQTGTHIDAPNHFDPDGDCLEMLDISKLAGSYFLVDLLKCNDLTSMTALCRDFAGEKILFLRAMKASSSIISMDALDILLALPPLVWIIDGQISVEDHDKYAFNRHLAYSGKYLAEDIDSAAAKKVTRGGEIFIMPLRLQGVSGSPCRVVVIL